MKKLLLLFLLIVCVQVNAQIITTVAGNNLQGFSGDGGQATLAEFYTPHSVAIDAAGNIYIADRNNNRIRKVNVSGIISTVAGNGTAGFSGDNGQATAATLNNPYNVVLDANGNLFIADGHNNRIRKVNASGIITTVVGNGIQGYSGDGGQATSAELYYPWDIAFDSKGNMYVADEGNNRIRKVNVSGIITTIAGDGTIGYIGDGGQAALSELNFSEGITVDGIDNIYIADSYNNVIRKIDTSGIITTVAGNNTVGFSGDGGQATSAQLHRPSRVAVDALGNIYFSDYYNNRIRKVNTSGIISTIAGNGTAGFSGDGGQATAAELYLPNGVALDIAGNLYIADEVNNTIRKVANVNGIEITTSTITQISVYPNPAKNIITLNRIGIENCQNITIQNTLGETVRKLSFTKNIDVSDLPQGCYFLQITLGNKETYKAKFIKQ